MSTSGDFWASTHSWWRRLAVAALLVGALALLVLWARTPAGGSFVRSLPQTLSTVRDGLLVLTQVLVLTVIVLVLLAVVVWLSRDDDRTQLLPFQNATVDASLTAVDQSLLAELQWILEIHQQPLPGIAAEHVSRTMISPNGDDLVSSLGNVGTIGFGPASVAVGPLLLALRGIWPLRGRHTVISGSVQRYGTTTRLVSRLRRGGRDLALSVEARGEGGHELVALIRDLAYRIHYAIPGATIQAGSWESFKAFTEARASYAAYLEQPVPARREAALECTRRAYQADRRNTRLYGLFLNVGNAFMTGDRIDLAAQLFGTAHELEPRELDPLPQLALCHFYRDRPEAGAEILQRALEIAPSSPVVHYLLGVMDQAVGRLDQAEADIQESLRLGYDPAAEARISLAALALRQGDRARWLELIGAVKEDDLPTSYDRACYWSVAGDPERALAFLRTALAEDQVPTAHVERDPDLSCLRAHQGFRQLLTAPRGVEGNGAAARTDRRATPGR